MRFGDGTQEKPAPKENAMVQKRSGTFPFLGKALLRFLLSCLVFFTPSPERILPGEKGAQLCSLWGRDVPGAVWFPLQRFPVLAYGGIGPPADRAIRVAARRAAKV